MKEVQGLVNKRQTLGETKKKNKVSGLLKLFINHAALEVLTIFSKVSTCDYNAKTFIMKEC